MMVSKDLYVYMLMNSGTYPSFGMMKFPRYGKIKNVPVTTNQMRYNPPVVSSGGVRNPHIFLQIKLKVPNHVGTTRKTNVVTSDFLDPECKLILPIWQMT